MVGERAHWGPPSGLTEGHQISNPTNDLFEFEIGYWWQMWGHHILGFKVFFIIKMSPMENGLFGEGGSHMGLLPIGVF